MSKTIGVIHPGEMGAGVAGALVSSGNTVMWAGEGRSEDTKRRAKEVGLVDVSNLATLLERCEIILSICPPHAALDVAREVSGFKGVYVDANAISPTHASEVASIVEGGGASYVDGGIIGAPHQLSRRGLSSLEPARPTSRRCGAVRGSRLRCSKRRALSPPRPRRCVMRAGTRARSR